MDAVVKTISPRTSRAQNLMEAQVGNGLNASQQNLAFAVWFDQRDLPRLASYFYRQSLRKRDHAMRIVQYMIDNNVAVEVPGLQTVRNDFSDPRELIALAVEQERVVTDEVTTLSRVLREEEDYLGEQFMRWFLSEQVDEVAQMTTMLNVTDRSQGNMFDLEDYLKRDPVENERYESTAPRAAGGKLR
ncbi:ferritin [Saccharopolyspora sp. TS4A08]|uniref:Ferritin n=1 Tax=Saccharopolyspora ipomoeae TaxID=3042027 RepID=A0ABT6PQH3_9PSEU|nr:ferritin [Saccharopolyspora sp. TS4A08]MDI2030261.1 ferritin [Saccharopolyspora sp. TS4A08]